MRVEFRPADENTGVVFVRRDLARPARIPAAGAPIASKLRAARRSRAAACSVEMVEHILAALAGLQIDNCEVWVDAARIARLRRLEPAVCRQRSMRPASSNKCARGRAGGAQHHALGRRRQLGRSPARRSRRHDVSSFASTTARGNAIGRQTLQLPVTPDSFRRELAPSRTFMLEEEADWLRRAGSASGPRIKNVLVFDKDGPIENELRYRDECVRHKALDLVGDLALAGCDLVGHFIAHRSGHRLNAELVRALLNEEEVVEEPAPFGLKQNQCQLVASMRCYGQGREPSRTRSDSSWPLTSPTTCRFIRGPKSTPMSRSARSASSARTSASAAARGWKTTSRSWAA